MKRILLSVFLLIGIGGLAGCQTCDVCDDCGDPIVDPHHGAYDQRCCGCGWHAHAGCSHCTSHEPTAHDELQAEPLKPVPAPAHSTDTTGQ